MCTSLESTECTLFTACSLFSRLPGTYNCICPHNIQQLYRSLIANQCSHHESVPSIYPSLGTLLLYGIDGATLFLDPVFLEHFPGTGRSAIRRNETGIRLELRLPHFIDFLKVHK